MKLQSQRGGGSFAPASSRGFGQLSTGHSKALGPRWGDIGSPRVVHRTEDRPWLLEVWGWRYSHGSGRRGGDPFDMVRQQDIWVKVGTGGGGWGLGAAGDAIVTAVGWCRIGLFYFRARCVWHKMEDPKGRMDSNLNGSLILSQIDHTPSRPTCTYCTVTAPIHASIRALPTSRYIRLLPGDHDGREGGWERAEPLWTAQTDQIEQRGEVPEDR